MGANECKGCACLQEITRFHGIEGLVRLNSWRFESSQPHTSSTKASRDLVLFFMYKYNAVIPLIGAMNEARIKNVITVTTKEVINKRLTIVIIDLSGLTDISEINLSDIVRIKEVIKLQGARLIVTGMSVEMILKTFQLKGFTHKKIETFASVQKVLEQLFTFNRN